MVAAAAAPSAVAAPQQATPGEDDVAFLVFAGVAEQLLARYYEAALGIPGAWSRSEKRALGAAGQHHRNNVDRINAALGPDDALRPGDYSDNLKLSTRAGALKVGRRLEALAGGTYLGGLAAAGDYGTRLLLGRLLGLATTNDALLTFWAGLPPGGLPAPIDLDAAGLRLDTYLTEPTS